MQYAVGGLAQQDCVLRDVWYCVATDDSSLNVSQRCVQDAYVQSRRRFRNAAYATVINYLMSDTFMNGVTEDC